MKRNVFGAVLLLFLLTVVAAAPLEARAGGGGRGGGSGGGGRGSLFLLLALGGYSAATSVLVTRKGREAKALLARLEQVDPAWEPDGLKRRLETTFFRVQYAWRDRDQTAARPYMSRRLHDKHELQLADMRAQGHKNVMVDVALEAAHIVEVLDYTGSARDSFRAVVCGSMVDYVIDERTGEKIGGSYEPQSFRELWTFTRELDEWVLDEISAGVSLAELRLLESVSEPLGTQSTRHKAP